MKKCYKKSQYWKTWFTTIENSYNNEEVSHDKGISQKQKI